MDGVVVGLFTLAGFIGGAVVDRLLAERQARQDRAVHAQQERARASRQAVAEAKVLLSDLNARRYTISYHPEEGPALLDRLETRWQSVRQALAHAELATQPQLREALSDLEQHIEETFHWLKWWTADKRAGRDDRDALGHALESYDAAHTSLGACMEVLDDVGE